MTDHPRRRHRRKPAPDERALDTAIDAFRNGGTITRAEYDAITAHMQRPLTLPVGRRGNTTITGKDVA